MKKRKTALRYDLIAVAALVAAMPAAVRAQAAPEDGYTGAADPIFTATTPDDADLEYVREMITHHQQVMELSRAILVSGRDPEVRMIAADTLKNGGAQIENLRRWMATHGPDEAYQRPKPPAMRARAGAPRMLDEMLDEVGAPPTAQPGVAVSGSAVFGAVQEPSLQGEPLGDLPLPTSR